MILVYYLSTPLVIWDCVHSSFTPYPQPPLSSVVSATSRVLEISGGIKELHFLTTPWADTNCLLWALTLLPLDCTLLIPLSMFSFPHHFILISPYLSRPPQISPWEVIPFPDAQLLQLDWGVLQLFHAVCPGLANYTSQAKSVQAWFCEWRSHSSTYCLWVSSLTKAELRL